jgi:hypothetical protein
MSSLPTNWRKSIRSNEKADCVEVANDSETALVRDTKDRAAGYLTLSPTAFVAFAASITKGHPAP